MRLLHVARKDGEDSFSGSEGLRSRKFLENIGNGFLKVNRFFVKFRTESETDSG